MRKIVRVAAYLIIVAMVSAAGSELFAGTYHFVHTGEVFWLRNAPRTVGSEEGEPLRPQTRQKLSPYLGYSLRPGWKLSANADIEQQKHEMGYAHKPEYWEWSANNLGFFSDRDYPYIPTERDKVFIVGISGGSVANGLALESRAEIASLIKSVPAHASKEVVVLNLCDGGYKQPQQLIALGYLIALGQSFDLIINMDGFNEAYIGWENVHDHRVHVTAPAAKFIFGLQNHMLSAYSQTAEKVFAVRAERQRLVKRMAATRSALDYYVTKIRTSRLQAEEISLESEIGFRKAEVDYPIVLLPTTHTDTEYMAEEIAGVWFRSSVAMKAMANSVGAAYIHIIQPNQYFTDRIFSEPEKKLAFSVPQHPAAVIVPPVYRRMLGAARQFPAHGITFIDATRAFDNHPEPLYFDSCCHFNKHGYDIVAKEQLSKAVGEVLAARR